jgi:hypothetical protein
VGTALRHRHPSKGTSMTQTELCKYGQEPASCTSNPMDCQCAIDASLAQTQEPDVQETLHWHAFNYRQAHTAQAHEMWQKLEQFVDSKIKASQRTERPVDCERCNRLEEHAYDLIGKLRVANIKLSMQSKACVYCGQLVARRRNDKRPRQKGCPCNGTSL